MQKLLKSFLLTTIVLLNCSTSWCQSKVSKGGVEPDTIPSTGVLEQTDSLVLIPVSALKVANAKMVELSYEKEINAKLYKIVNNDSLIIDGLKYELDTCIAESEIKAKRLKRERNIFIVTTIVAALASILVLVK